MSRPPKLFLGTLFTAALAAGCADRAEQDLRASLDQEARVLRVEEFADAGRKRSLFRDTLVPKAEQGLGAARTAFAAGKASFTDLIDAERTLLELRLMAARASTDQQIRLAELERLAGRELRGGGG